MLNPADLPPGGARAVARCDLLGIAPYSDMEGGLYRAYLTPAHRAALDTVRAWMAAAGMTVELDPAANLVGHYPGTGDGPPLIIASHIDSVRDAGRYDGPLGIMLGIECVAALHGAGRHLPFPILIYAFGDEEGSRFPAAMLTSRAVAGTVDPTTLDMVDGSDISLAEALAGFGKDVAALRQARLPAALAYLEAHIEQGPVLEAEGLALGTVTGIAAQLRYQVSVTGQAGHAGTSSMPLRRDALAGAAAMVVAIEGIARLDASDLVATVGRLDVTPGAPNVVPGAVHFTIDIRSGDVARRDSAAEAILEELHDIADARNLDFSAELVHDLPASPCDPRLMNLMDQALLAEGLPVRRLVSGAGHDAMVLSSLCPTAMLFIRCKDGISHNPAESVAVGDVELAFRVMMRFLDLFGDSIDN